ncbi:MAG: acyl-CoA dehydrogenase family protein [Deltaproteobacteria bacterium]|nr:acyl-CoA dehydrogenase family protein [Deltaproteobacteria bacterium]
MAQRGLDSDSLEQVLRSISQFAARSVSLSWRLATDDSHEFPIDIIKQLMGPEVGLHLIYIPEEFGGLDAGAYDTSRVSEAMARVDLGLATAFFAISLGLDPIAVGATPEQKQKWMTKVAEEGLLVAYGVTEPSAGSDLGALKAKAERFERDGKKYYRISGNKQFITNGGVADIYTILANTEAGPTFFIVEKGTPGLSAGKPEDKHGIRMSNTCALTLDDVEVPEENVIGGIEGRGLAQAQQVFGYTRLMVAAFGLGGGEAALARMIGYSRERRQGGSLLAEKQAYTHKLIVPNAIRLAAARAYIEYVATRLDSGEEDLQTEGAIAKLCASEAGVDAADAAIQAHGGYGYIREYEVEKIRRDVRITTIYEGTSEIMQWTIARDRWRLFLQSQGGFYRDLANSLDSLHAQTPDVGANIAALGIRSLHALFDRAREKRLTRHQHVLFRLGELCMQAETAATLARAAAGAARGPKPTANTHKAMARVYAREAAAKVVNEGIKWVRGCDAQEDTTLLERNLRLSEINAAYSGMMADLDTIAHELCAVESSFGQSKNRGCP